MYTSAYPKLYKEMFCHLKFILVVIFVMATSIGAWVRVLELYNSSYIHK